MSYSSAISAMSLSQTGSTGTSASSVESGRRMPPVLDQTKLPPLPPTRREREAKEAEERANPPKTPLISMKSAPNVPIRPPPAVDRDLAPKMPPRPNGLPRIPSRSNLQEEQPPTQPPRRLPPPSAARSALTMGFGNKSNETPNPAPSPVPTLTRPARPAGALIQELDDRNFDSLIMSGRASFVDFYLPSCTYCVQLEPIWKQFAEDYSPHSDRLVFAKMDVQKYRKYMNRFNLQEFPSMMYFDGRSETPQKCQFTLETWYLKQWMEEKSGISADEPPKSSGAPPPINMSSKPSRSQVQATQSRPAPSAPPTSGCLICRDFSEPDRVASQYPRHSLPRTGDNTGYLADVLCGPFTSATDKARAIFTWLHLNVAYDTAAFFGNRVKYVDPKDTITSGLAVCGGYAGVLTAIALKAGLEAVMVTGHGKGYGYSALKSGEPVPECNPTGHAWNAVRIDGGEWKLMDSCWGAGNVENGNQAYTAHFKPSYFTMSNDEFGLKHFPEDDSYFFRSDGQIPSWEDYYLGPARAEPLQLYGSADDHGLSTTSFAPPQKQIPINSGEVVRFQFSKMCEHWDHEKNGKGKPYPFVIKINGVDGRRDDYVAMENNDFWWWADIPAKDLGAPGQTVSCYTVTTVNGKDSRGMTRREYLNKKGRSAMSFGGVSAWTCV